MSKKTVFTDTMKKLFKGRDLEADAASLVVISKANLQDIIAGDKELSIGNAILIGKLTNTDAQFLLDAQTESILAKMGYTAPKPEKSKGTADGSPSKSPMHRTRRSDMCGSSGMGDG